MSEEIKHPLEYSVYSCKVTWCPICSEHFYNERNKSCTTKATSEHYHTIHAPVKPVEHELKSCEHLLKLTAKNNYSCINCQLNVFLYHDGDMKDNKIELLQRNRDLDDLIILGV